MLHVRQHDYFSHSTQVHSLYKQNSPLSGLDFFFGGSCEGILRLQYKHGKAQVLL